MWGIMQHSCSATNPNSNSKTEFVCCSKPYFKLTFLQNSSLHLVERLQKQCTPTSLHTQPWRVPCHMRTALTETENKMLSKSETETKRILNLTQRSNIMPRNDPCFVDIIRGSLARINLGLQQKTPCPWGTKAHWEHCPHISCLEKVKAVTTRYSS